MPSTIRARCTECGGPLSGKQKYTCCEKHRAARSRRLNRERMARQHPENRGTGTPRNSHEIQMAQEVASEQLKDAAHEVMVKELTPVVREAITEDVLRAIADMVALTPQMVTAIADDLSADDPQIRQRAYTLLAKYTVGQLAPEQTDPSRQMTVNFNLPRPDDTGPAQPPIPAEAEELKPCDICGEDKPLSSFIDNSDRCETCYKRFRDEVEARFGSEA